MKVLVTGVTGPVGSLVTQALLARGDEVVGIDSLAGAGVSVADYARLGRAQANPRFRFDPLDVRERSAVEACLASGGFAQVVHLPRQLGAEAAVSPGFAGGAGLVGFLNLLEACIGHGVGHVVYTSGTALGASGPSGHVAVGDLLDRARPLEVMASMYARLHGLASTGLRYMVVGTRAQRPGATLAAFGAAAGSQVGAGREGGGLAESAGPVDDVVDGVLRALRLAPSTRVCAADATQPPAVARVLDVGRHDAQRMLDWIDTQDDSMRRGGGLRVMSTRPGLEPLPADPVDAVGALGRLTRTLPLAEGIHRFVTWKQAHDGSTPPLFPPSMKGAGRSLADEPSRQPGSESTRTPRATAYRRKTFGVAR